LSKSEDVLVTDNQSVDPTFDVEASDYNNVSDKFGRIPPCIVKTNWNL